MVDMPADTGRHSRHKVRLMSTIAPMDPQRRQTQERAAESITDAFHARLLDLVNEGVQLTALGTVAITPWSDIVGPCYTSGALQREIDRGRGALSKAVSELRALRLETADHQTLYPSFQVRNGALVPGLQDVLVALREGINDPWTWAQWLTAQPQGRDGEERRRHIDELIDGDIDEVVTAAKQAAAAWAA
jgi:hypothetical protein